MRETTRHQREDIRLLRDKRSGRTAKLCVAVTLLAMLGGCGGIVGGSGTPPPPAIKVTVIPGSANVLLGEAANFQAQVQGTSNTGVSWSVNGIAGGNAQVGTISSSGEFTAPNILPNPATVTIAATSQADVNASGSASVNITSDVGVGVAPTPVTLAPLSKQAFTATVTSAGKPAMDVMWSVNGVAGGNGTLGTISSTGADAALYVAPTQPPSPATVMVQATSVADTSKVGDAQVTILCATPNSISPGSANVGLGMTQDYSATLCAAPGSAVTWDVNGVVGGNSSLGTVTNKGTNATTYSAPVDLPANNPVTIHAVAGSASAAATATITSSVTVSVAPPSVTIAVNTRTTFSAVVTGTSDGAATWSVNGIVNGDAAVGEICQSGSNPCVAPAGAVGGSVDYSAPAAIPSANPVRLTAVSRADSTKSGTAQVNVTATSGGPVAVTIAPPFAFIAPSGVSASRLQFRARVNGAANAAVTWSVASGVAGSGCGGTACGTIDANGLYTAPNLTPSPNAIAVTATSVQDATQSATANIALTGGPAIEQILPSSVMAGVASSFTLGVFGVNFVAGSGGTASVILVNGEARPTVCQTSLRCTTPLQPGDTGTAGTLTVQIQSPGSPGALSNPVPFVVVPFTLTENVISLSAAAPSVAADIVVFEPTSAAATPSQINVDFAGPITSGPTCNFDSNPITVTRPASGTATFSICVHGSTLDSSFFYELSGPQPPDISVVASSLGGIFPNLVQLDLTISNATLPGLRSLFITTPNNDKAVATGLLEVK